MCCVHFPAAAHVRLKQILEYLHGHVLDEWRKDNCPTEMQKSSSEQQDAVHQYKDIYNS